MISGALVTGLVGFIRRGGEIPFSLPFEDAVRKHPSLSQEESSGHALNQLTFDLGLHSLCVLHHLSMVFCCSSLTSTLSFYLSKWPGLKKKNDQSKMSKF